MMNLMGDNWVRAERWMVVTLAAFVIVAQPFLASAREPIAKPGACCNKCKCCVSSDSGGTSQPAAPVPTRTTIAKDFQLIAVLHALLLPAPTASALIPLDSPAPDFSTSVPLFVRHCSFLI